ncbi:MAG TPA: hypothetical protein VNO13_05450, partial [Candidatus Udaeobacter sp.]|nr:hypothetical protein [Candidatus Udaeobacter sp.]
MAYYSQPSAHPQERRQYEIQKSRPWSAGAAILLGAATAAARSYNPMKWIKKPTASQELAANSAEEKALTLQLQALLPARTTLKDACTLFKTLDDCAASLHASSNLQI